MNLLDISGNDIAELNDGELRTLIGLLCESEYRNAGHSTKGITWGGSQDAPDGGLDVVVNTEVGLSNESFIPKKYTGFQVKKPSMPPSAIKKEMSLNGTLRGVINKIGEENGAYIIVSSGDSTSDSGLKNRINEMKKSIHVLDDDKKPFLDFYDRGRIASWARQHPSCIIWIWSKLGRNISGWLPYENWSNNKADDNDYILDDDLRLHNNTKSNKDGVTIEKGLSQLRSSLLPIRSSVRLTGLSGVGKTRLCEALFDTRIGNDALNPSLVIYTDISFSSNPEPVAMAEQLVASKSRAILIVDNCSPELHRALTKICSKNVSRVSLLTVEYDIKDDLPDETEVFRLEPASIEVIEKLIKKRFVHVSDLDARTISEFSGGNARVAIALANTLRQGDNLNNLRDEDLFQRLFRQRNNDNKDLLKSAQICSLVYSFEGEDIASEKSELKVLANLQGKNPSELYADISSLKDRGMVQSRGVWRAVLPHAIANRLAKQALNQIPKDSIMNVFQTSSDRLLKSFSKRLSYLHNEQVAIDISSIWLDENGWLGNSIQNFNGLGISVFENIAPISPELTLEAIERVANSEGGVIFTSRANSHYNEFVRILALIAYDKELFHRAVELIIRFALAEKPEENYNSTRDVLKALFQQYLSGTHAYYHEKSALIEKLLDDQNPIRNQLGVLLLNSCLDSHHFSSNYPHQFGARSRDYGYQPQTEGEYNKWYQCFVQLGGNYGLLDSDLAKNIRLVLANHLGSLIEMKIFEDVEKVILDFHSKQGWNDGWMAIKRTLRYDKDNLGNKKKRLVALEKLLRPKNLESEIRAYALTCSRLSHFDILDDLGEDEDYRAKEKKVAQKTFDLGKKLAQQKPLFEKLITDLFSIQNIRLLELGKGYASSCTNLLEIWIELADKIKLVDTNEVNFLFMFGFLSYCDELHNDVYHQILDKVLKDEFLKKWFPRFQCVGSVDGKGLERLHHALDNDSSYPWTYNDLSYGKAYSQIDDYNIALLIEKLSGKEGGMAPSIEIIALRFLRERKDGVPITKKIVEVAFKLLSNLPFKEGERDGGMRDYRLAEIAEVCLDERYGYSNSEELCQHIFDSIEANNLYPSNYSKFLKTVAKKQPSIFLDTFLIKNDPTNYRFRHLFRDSYQRNQSPINDIPDNILIDWCEINPKERFPIILEKMSCFRTTEQRGLDWKPIVYCILIKAEDKQLILRKLKNSIDPTSWSGSKAEILKKRIVLFDMLHNHGNENVKKWAIQEKEKFLKYIETIQESEAARNRIRHESFE
ncbi:hypothetical protein QSE00_09855 [Arenibacter sp. M-2]|uniref:hypothetical protein n=1 Tax=Arenibacter sp. M-2 TaxID=3053612 RepID=UPI00256FB915|nr:hypothetical protein [Arenibacter sp. M-2]MDL5512117.1 hypothetical protein [Arenibacter sp. M-2]